MARDFSDKIRSKVRSGALPIPRELPTKQFVGRGTNRACDGCDELITPEQIESETDLDGRTLRFHAVCLAEYYGILSDGHAPTLLTMQLVKQSPLCGACISAASGIDVGDIERAAIRIEPTIALNRDIALCKGCGRWTLVYSILGPRKK